MAVHYKVADAAACKAEKIANAGLWPGNSGGKKYRTEKGPLNNFFY
jgi:hypothetical protein